MIQVIGFVQRLAENGFIYVVCMPSRDQVFLTIFGKIIGCSKYIYAIRSIKILSNTLQKKRTHRVTKRGENKLQVILQKNKPATDAGVSETDLIVDFQV